MATSTGTDGTSNVQSVERAIAILEYLARNEAVGATEVGEALGIHKSTAFRLLNTLVDRDLVDQHSQTGKYRLGLGIVHLANAVQVDPDVTRQAQESLEWLAQQVEETVTLAVLESNESVTIDQILSSTTVSGRSWHGRRTPLHCSSPGKIFLAYMDEPERSQIIAGRHGRYTENTITRPTLLAEEIDAVREAGFATTYAEFEEDLCAAAAPIFGVDGSVVAAIGITGPYYRLGRDELQAARALIQQAAQMASVGSSYEEATTDEDG